MTIHLLTKTHRVQCGRPRLKVMVISDPVAVTCTQCLQGFRRAQHAAKRDPLDDHEAVEAGRVATADAVSHPAHYTPDGGIECIDAVKAATRGLDGIEAFDTGTAMKYLWRWKRKGKPLEDLRKAKWYIDHLIDHLSK